MSNSQVSWAGPPSESGPTQRSICSLSGGSVRTNTCGTAREIENILQPEQWSMY